VRAHACALLVIVLAGVAGARLAVPVAASTGGTGSASAPVAPPEPSFPVGIRVVRLVDASRRIRLPGGRLVPRTLLTYVRYPAVGPPGATDLAGAPAARSSGPFPLVVFGHGFAVTPTIYARLLQSWARAGYVVAAPVFPLANPAAPGGPTESDLVNQPGDMTFVISSLLLANGTPGSPFEGLVVPAQVAVAGQSDGGETALASAYNTRARDPRVDAAVILSGAEMSGLGGRWFPAGSPPLLAAQGTADTINPRRITESFFAKARRPKYLLRLLGAEHLPPYTHQQPQLGIVERTSIAFLDRYLKHTVAAQQLLAFGRVPRTASLLVEE
jgi:dienelactone hydrolase